MLTFPALSQDLFLAVDPYWIIMLAISGLHSRLPLVGNRGIKPIPGDSGWYFTTSHLSRECLVSINPGTSDQTGAVTCTVLLPYAARVVFSWFGFFETWN